LGAFVKQHEAKKPDQPVINLVRHAQEDTDDRRFLLDGLGRLWLSGVSIDWAAFQAGGKRRRLSLPTYPFEKQRFWIDEAMFRQAVAGLFSGAANAFTLPEGGFQIESPAASMPGGFEPAYTAPRNEIEETIAQVWQEVLGFTRISIDSNFFDISGDSLTATQLVNRLKLVYEVEIPLKRFFESPTIAQLADTITQLLMEKVAGLSSEEVQKELTGGETATDPGQQEV
jgi:acyl carrier protein